ncbi:Sodium- and chloride-dependent creatine transporter 1 [Orchesella cincta]|uniref:Sodium-and chloride-dependent creatine transporter 1 n=1 Tax=Orchesella cincta TaxID=48709 RepID=A0A1D2M3M6_ORCCI|nr:Sodium- and chloride-dependent creatine transporter 1 [Orchesella cincta]
MIAGTSTTEAASECGIPRTSNATTNTTPNQSGSPAGGSTPSTTPGAPPSSTPTAAANAASPSSNNNGSSSSSRQRPRAPQAPSSTSAPRSELELTEIMQLVVGPPVELCFSRNRCTLGLNNICRFSLLSVQYGANFILQFMFLSIVFGIPLLTFHMSIGQYLNRNRSGLVISQAMIGIYTTVGVSWIFIYFRDSFITRSDQYRWGKCVREFRGAAYKNDCEPIYGYNNISSAHMFNENSAGLFQVFLLTKMCPVSQHYSAVVLQRASPNYPDSAYVPSSLKFTVAFNLAVVWMLVFVSLSKGTATSQEY